MSYVSINHSSASTKTCHWVNDSWSILFLINNFPSVLDIICRVLYDLWCNKYLNSLIVYFYNWGYCCLMDRWMDRWSCLDEHAGMLEETQCRLAREGRGSFCQWVWGAGKASLDQDLPWQCWQARRGRLRASGSGQWQMSQNVITCSMQQKISNQLFIFSFKNHQIKITRRSRN